MSNLHIDAARLWDALMETAAIGGTPDGGVRRLTLTEEDRQVRNWFKSQCEALGCTVTVDEVGNMFALRAGTDPSALPVAMGSHLDTQPAGGKFDGILGVLAGLEIFRTLADAGCATRRPLLLVNWTNEEGSRFSPAMLGSGVHADVFDRRYADTRVDADGAFFGDALEAIGYRGTIKAGSVKFAAMFELHIEQGPLLERANIDIGVVTGVQGMRWYDLEIGGRQAHAGSTPMDMRQDALTAAAHVILGVERIADEYAGLATVGELTIQNASRNVVPGCVRMTVDLRHPDDSVLDGMEEAMNGLFEASNPSGPIITCRRTWHSPAVRFDPACVAAVAAAAVHGGYSTLEMTSGSGHDSVYVSRIAPTAMIFVPCKDGLSHNPLESSTIGQCTAGAEALMNVVLNVAGLVEAGIHACVDAPVT